MHPTAKNRMFILSLEVLLSLCNLQVFIAAAYGSGNSERYEINLQICTDVTLGAQFAAVQ